MDRPTLSHDGKGINGPDKYRTRLATFASEDAADVYGEMFAAAPELLAALRVLLERYTFHEQDEEQARTAIAKAEGRA